jgi:hypothetical protein
MKKIYLRVLIRMVCHIHKCGASRLTWLFTPHSPAGAFAWMFLTIGPLGLVIRPDLLLNRAMLTICTG